MCETPELKVVFTQFKQRSWVSITKRYTPWRSGKFIAQFCLVIFMIFLLLARFRLDFGLFCYYNIQGT